jgi:2-methylcitrate dehydratase PrpD
MTRRDGAFDRRWFLGAGACALVGLPRAAGAQQAAAPAARGAMQQADARRVSALIADFITTLDMKAVPQPVIERARTVFVDTIGVMLAGSHEDVSHLMVEMVKAEASAPQATVVGQALRASPQLAALANGVASHAMDYDFTFMRGQAAAAVIPAILPVAEMVGATPAEMMAAYIVGAEVVARVVRADQDGPLFEAWHTTGIVGVIGAAAACARLMKVPAAAIPDVIGIAASLASGFNANFGTMSKPLHCGNAARNGVMAALLGKSGFTSNPAAIEGRHGYLNSIGRDLPVSVEAFKDLGRRYDLVEGRHRFKPYPCGGLTHTSIEAALELRGKVGARLAEIKSIHCFVARSAGQRAGTQYPTTVEAAKFSVGYLVPYALVHGAPKIAAFTERALQDERLKALAATVTASVDPELGPGGDDSPARIRITLADGQVLEQRKDYASGSYRNPITPAQLEEKFFDCVAQAMSPAVAQNVLAVLNRLPSGESLSDLWSLLRKA